MDRPRVLVNVAESLDGKINPAHAWRTGPFQMSRGTTDIERMVALRAQADAVLIGASNLRADDPDLALPPLEHARRRAEGQAEPLRVVITRRGEGIIPTSRMFDASKGGPAVVAHTSQITAVARASLKPVATLVELGDEEVSMPALLAWLGEQGVRVVLCEGGGEINAKLFEASAVDELYLTIVPRVLGGATAPTTVGGAGFPPNAVGDPKLGSLERVGDELYLRYDFTWPT
jgi:5-amino-6-(5-phosphoribosylamino)uracil reductase